MSVLNLQWLGRAGEGGRTPIVFLHGFMGCGEDWRVVAEALLESRGGMYCPLLVDLPGHGQSSGDISNFQSVVCDLVDALRQRRVERAVFVGYSLGGRIALAVADAYPQLVQQLILESASPGIEDEEARQQRLAADRVLLHDVLQGEQTFEGFLELWYHSPIFAGVMESPGYRQLLARRLRNDPARLQDALNVLSVGSMPPLWQRLGTLEMPLLYICGQNDTKCLAIANRIKEIAPSATLNVIPGCSHNAHYQNPHEFIRILLGTV